MTSDTVFHACEYDKLSSNRNVYNLNSLSEFVLIDIDADEFRYLTFFQMNEISEGKNQEIDLTHMVERDRHYLRMPIRILNRTAGLHTYKLLFVNPQTDEVKQTFFSYIIQDDNPDKLYKLETQQHLQNLENIHKSSKVPPLTSKELDRLPVVPLDELKGDDKCARCNCCFKNVSNQ